MSRRSVGDDIRSVYQSKQPAPATLERLVAMESATRGAGSKAGWTASFWLRAAAAVALVAVGLWLGLGQFGRSDVATRQIAEEIASNHTHHPEVDYETASWSELRTLMDRLDFSLVRPESGLSAQARLVGARYCSLQGQLAVQVRLEAADGERLTLYQTAFRGGVAEIEPARLRSGGLEIELWNESGVFLGTARSPGP